LTYDTALMPHYSALHQMESTLKFHSSFLEDLR